jgi:hypothetical protein
MPGSDTRAAVGSSSLMTLPHVCVSDHRENSVEGIRR